MNPHTLYFGVRANKFQNSNASIQNSNAPPWFSHSLSNQPEVITVGVQFLILGSLHPHTDEYGSTRTIKLSHRHLNLSHRSSQARSTFNIAANRRIMMTISCLQLGLMAAMRGT